MPGVTPLPLSRTETMTALLAGPLCTSTATFPEVLSTALIAFLSRFSITQPKSTGLSDHLGGFAVTTGIGLKELCDGFRAKQDDYNAIMAEALADRLAEAFAEYLHEQVRRQWRYGRDEKLTKEQLIREEYRGIRPAPGYPACPDHAVKAPLFALLDAEAIGMTVTESYAMWPAASVSGFYLAHPDSRYFAVGRIGDDQLRDFAARDQIPLEDARRRLAPNL